MIVVVVVIVVVFDASWSVFSFGGRVTLLRDGFCVSATGSLWNGMKSWPWSTTIPYVRVFSNSFVRTISPEGEYTSDPTPKCL